MTEQQTDHEQQQIAPLMEAVTAYAMKVNGDGQQVIDVIGTSLALQAVEAAALALVRKQDTERALADFMGCPDCRAHFQSGHVRKQDDGAVRRLVDDSTLAHPALAFINRVREASMTEHPVGADEARLRKQIAVAFDKTRTGCSDPECDTCVPDRALDAYAEAVRRPLLTALELIRSEDSAAWVDWLGDVGFEIDGRPFYVMIADAAINDARSSQKETASE